MKPLKESLDKIPTSCGVYLMKNQIGRIIYIGKAKNLKLRVRSYFLKDKSFKNIFLVPLIHKVDYILTGTEVEAYLLEANLVKKHKPRYNIRLKDDKSYPYIRCSVEEVFPRFYVERRVKQKGSLYFGPYTDTFFARRMVRFLNEHFKIRDCSNYFMKGRIKPCLTFDIGNCTAPCVNKVSEKKYQEQVKGSLSFLRGGGRTVLKDMKTQMDLLSRKERFEEALRLRDRIRAIEFCREKQSVVSSKEKNLDVLVFYGDKEATVFESLHVRAGAVMGHRFHYESHINQKQGEVFQEAFCSFITQYYMDNLIPPLILLSSQKLETEQKKELFKTLEKVLFKINSQACSVRGPRGSLEKNLVQMALKNAESRFKDMSSKESVILKGLQDIQKKFHLKNIPERIECFDVSHFQGRDQVASQVVFENGVPKKEDYRKYKIREVRGSDDFASLTEVLSRRFQHEEYTDPQVLIVDGGKGQLSSALRALKQLGREDISVVAMAKARVHSDFTSKDLKTSSERFFLPGRKNPVLFPPNSEAHRILVHLRNEAHRFAITYHRKLSQKSLFS